MKNALGHSFSHYLLYPSASSRTSKILKITRSFAWFRRPLNVDTAAYSIYSIRKSLLMAPKQATLGNFFNGQNGVKSAPPQQSKLKFSSKTNTPANGAGNEDSTGKSEAKDADGEDVKMKDVTKSSIEHGAASSSEEGSESRSPSPQSGRKRPTSGDPMVISDDEPPTKKTRLKSAIKKSHKHEIASENEVQTPKNKSSSKQGNRKNVTFESHEKGETDRKISRKATPKKPTRDADDHIEDLESNNNASPTASSESKIPQTTQEEQPATEEVTSESEEAEEEEEEEKPEVAAKKLKTVQSTLTSKSNDPYPDWKAGAPVPYAALCTTFSKIEMTTKRLEISAHCSLFLRQVLRLTPEDLLPVILLMINKLAADYTGIELGIGESLIMKAIGETTGRSLAVIKADQNEIGDLGLVAAKSRGNQPTMFKPKPLTVRSVHEGLLGIATVEGQGSQGRKIAAIKKLLSAADVHLAGKAGKGVDITKDKGGPSESKYIIRTLEGKMRLGLADKTVLVALAHAMTIHDVAKDGTKAASTEQLAKGESILKSVYSELPSYEVIVPAFLEHGLWALHENCKLQPGVPLKPMLAKPTKSITEVLDRFEGKDFSCEYKYDGERAQIHFVAHDAAESPATAMPAAGKTEKGVSNIFSRNSEDLSKKYPDILAKLPTWVNDGTKSFVLDCETVAWDLVEKKVLPFQQLMTRKRKDVKVEDVKVKVCVFAFDLLYLNGEALVNKPFRERRNFMHKAFTEVEGEFAFAKYGNTNQLEEIQNLLEESVKASCEGLMVKMLDGVESNYEPSRRSQNWLKVKKDYLSGVGDSLDLVVLGAYFGRGKRTSVYGAFLLACYNPKNELFESVCNIGTGFSEALLEELHSQLSPIIIDRPKQFYSHSDGNKDQPDVWFEPRYVWEVKTADLTVSPRYKAAAAEIEQIAHGKGISLRFPRFLKVRDDKKPEDATTSRAVAEMYRNQEAVTKNKGPSVDDDFDY